MSRSVTLLSLATLTLLASCVDLRLPSSVSQCEKKNNCTDGTGGATGGMGGTSARSGGSMSRSADAGISDVPTGGRGGSGGTSAGTGGASGGSTTGGSTGGTGGAVGGSSGSFDAGTDPTPDAALDKPIGNSDTPFDTEVKLDTQADTNKTGPEVGSPEAGPDAPLDLPLDRLPDTPDPGADTLNCIQSLKANNYAVSGSADAGLKACSECKTSSGFSMETVCKAMVDCVAKAWVCRPTSPSDCWLKCRNDVAGDMVLDTCVTTLVNKACPP